MQHCVYHRIGNNGEYVCLRVLILTVNVKCLKPNFNGEECGKETEKQKWPDIVINPNGHFVVLAMYSSPAHVMKISAVAYKSFSTSNPSKSMYTDTAFYVLSMIPRSNLLLDVGGHFLFWALARAPGLHLNFFERNQKFYSCLIHHSSISSDLI